MPDTVDIPRYLVARLDLEHLVVKFILELICPGQSSPLEVKLGDAVLTPPHMVEHACQGKVLGSQKAHPTCDQALHLPSNFIQTTETKLVRHIIDFSAFAKNILQGTVQGKRKEADKEKRWEDNIREWTGPDKRKILRRAESQSEWKTKL
ncbi:hypothetical protein PoB_000321600 [Plakobranchus ocellatus]|uniref:Uncharacterized protein n=1 Tax=Plakobranchus ocellatus TaxID=259542 RepID=A0AAV3Y0T3_9GAST|nr:hypothetical protein PoB_000321600 [Plakobranchus ocellatus]